MEALAQSALVSSEDHKEGLAALREKREPCFRER
jgi:enoyl-CoA hydratase/carnithine racemase